jgi:hypothetical protein
MSSGLITISKDNPLYTRPCLRAPAEQTDGGSKIPAAARQENLEKLAALATFTKPQLVHISSK